MNIKTWRRIVWNKRSSLSKIENWKLKKKIGSIQYVYFNCYTSTKSWRGYISLQFVCVYVYVCVCVCERVWKKFQPNGCTNFDASFAQCLHTTLAQTLFQLVTLSQRSRSISFFLNNSLLTSLLYFSALLCTIKMKIGMSLRYALSRLAIDFH